MVLAERVRFHLFRSVKGFSIVLHYYFCSYRLVPLPKSATSSRIKSNTEIYDFSLGPEDITLLDNLDLGSAGAISWNPVDAA